MNTISNPFKFLVATTLLATYGLGAPAATVAGPDVCDADGVGHSPQNVVLFMLDDVSWGEFPALNLPIRWPNDDAPPTSPATYKELLNDASARRPDLNRLAARILAASTNTDCGVAQGSGDPAVSPNEPCLGAAAGAPVVPVDSDAPADTFRYSTAIDADPVHHILEGHGGLARLVQNGVAFSRYYSTSGKCAPSRSSVMTGRYPVQVGVPENNSKLEEEEVTVGDYLKTLCSDSEAAGTPCYTTGYIGKWHLGERRNNQGEVRAPWTRGFDQAFYYPGKARTHTATTDLTCAPAAQQFFCTSPAIEDNTVHPCDEDAHCVGFSGCAVAGTCSCSVNPDTSGHGFCYESNPTTSCDPNVSSCSGSARCLAWGAYIGSENRTVCHPDDLANPNCCSPRSSRSKRSADRYSMKKQVAGHRYWQKDRTNDRVCDVNAWSTLDDPGVDQRACAYDTRYYRDVAKNFILRNAPAPEDDSKRFFLYFAPHALHKASSAPIRTEEHYKTEGLVPKSPKTPEAFWGALEEVDAAVGQILEVINGYCDGDPVALDDYYGTPCSDSAGAEDCTGAGGTCNTSLRDNTLVLFTSDQGRPSSGYGEPVLRDGKGSVYEGGIRTGLLAWGPGLGVEAPSPGEVLATEVGSHVDLFATIAHAAGCAPSTTSEGRYEVKVCDDATRRFCNGNADCDSGTICESRLLAGRTLLPVLSPTVATATGIGPRDFAFAQYTHAGKAIVAREGAFDVKVCGQVVSAGPVDEPGSTGDRIARERRWGSCTVCSSNADCTGTCDVQGTFCVPPGRKVACEQGLGTCEPLQYARTADGTCEGSNVAMQLRVPCDEVCSTTSAWKLRGGEGGAPIEPKDLFDLVTNSEEEELLNCVLEPPATEPTDPASLDYVQDQLRRRLGAWWNCASGSAETTDCDAQIAAFSAPAP